MVLWGAFADFYHGTGVQSGSYRPAVWDDFGLSWAD